MLLHQLLDFASSRTDDLGGFSDSGSRSLRCLPSFLSEESQAYSELLMPDAKHEFPRFQLCLVRFPEYFLSCLRASTTFLQRKSSPQTLCQEVSPTLS